MTTQREIDISTGKPRVEWDDSLQVAAEHRDLYSDRVGEIVHVLFLGHLSAFGQSFAPGERLEIEVGSSEWWQSVDREGRSFLDLEPEQQLTRYKKVQFVTGTSPPQPRNIPSTDTPAPRPKPDASLDVLKAIWREEDRIAAEPYRQASRHQEYHQSS